MTIPRWRRTRSTGRACIMTRCLARWSRWTTRPRIACAMFSSRRVLLRPDGWVTVELKDDWYGSTEYRATVED